MTGQESWVMYWAGFSALVGLATLVVLMMTAYYARSLFEATAESAKVNLTNDVVNSDWCKQGLSAFEEFFKSQGSDPVRARDSLVELIASADASRVKHPHLDSLERYSLSAYIYMALLYRRGVLDRYLLMESGLAAVAMISYVGQDRILELARSGFYDRNILEFGNDCVKRFIQRPGIVASYPYLKDFRLRL